MSSDIVNLIFNQIHHAMEEMQRAKVGHIELVTSTNRDGFCMDYMVDGKEHMISVEPFGERRTTNDDA